jgi:hypothetical protein
MQPLSQQILTGFQVFYGTISIEPFTTKGKRSIKVVKPFLKCDFGSFFPLPF